MKNISFALTTDQVRSRRKPVTRRLGWTELEAGALLQPIVKGMGLKKGQTPERIGGPIRVLEVRRERLDRMLTDEAYGRAEVVLEGFPLLSPAQFVEMFCRSHKGCTPETVVTRIHFEYVDPMTDAEIVDAIRREHKTFNIRQHEQHRTCDIRWHEARVDAGGTVFGPGPYLRVPVACSHVGDDTVCRVYPTARLLKDLQAIGRAER